MNIKLALKQNKIFCSNHDFTSAKTATVLVENTVNLYTSYLRKD